MVLLDDLGVVAPRAAAVRAAACAASTKANSPRTCRAGARESHKGSNGRVLVIGGGAGMPGALRLAGEAALRVGAGLVTVAGAAENLVAVTATRPELIYLPVAPARVSTRPSRACDVVAIGPGLGPRRLGAASLGDACARRRHSRGGRRGCAQPAGAGR